LGRLDPPGPPGNGQPPHKPEGRSPQREAPDLHLTPAQIVGLLAFYLPARTKPSEEELLKRIQFERRRQRISTAAKKRKSKA
jgi:hypothetical protein